MEKTLLDMRSNCFYHFYHFSFQLDCMQLLCLQKKVLNLPPKQLSNPHSSRAVTLSKLFNSNRQKQTSPKSRINFLLTVTKKGTIPASHWVYYLWAVPFDNGSSNKYYFCSLTYIWHSTVIFQHTRLSSCNHSIFNLTYANFDMCNTIKKRK